MFGWRCPVLPVTSFLRWSKFGVWAPIGPEIPPRQCCQLPGANVEAAAPAAARGDDEEESDGG
jgi:hypothetical protein